MVCMDGRIGLYALREEVVEGVRRNYGSIKIKTTFTETTLAFTLNPVV